MVTVVLAKDTIRAMLRSWSIAFAGNLLGVPAIASSVILAVTGKPTRRGGQHALAIATHKITLLQCGMPAVCSVMSLYVLCYGSAIQPAPRR